MSNTRKFLAAAFACLLVLALLAPIWAGNGTKTVTLVTDNGNGSYTLTMASSSAVTVGDHFGARTGSTSGPGGVWEVMSKPDGVSVIVSDTLTEENAAVAFGPPIAGDAWYGTPSALGYSRIPHLAKAYDAAIRRNAYIDGLVAHGGTGATTAAGARSALGLVIGTNVQAFDAQLSSVAALSYGSNALKVIRVNAGETDFELATVTGNVVDTLASTLGAGADGNDVDMTNLGSLTLASTELISINGAKLIQGTGSPESAVTAGIGSVFHRTDGGSGTTLYVKESGSGNTGWVAVAPGSGNVVDTLAATLGAGADGNAVDQTNLGSLTLAVNKTVTTSGTGDLVAGDDLTVGDDATVTDVLTVNGSTNLGNATADTVTITGPLSVNSSVGTAGQFLTSGGPGAVMTWSSGGSTTRTVEDNTAGSGSPNQLLSGESSNVLTNQGATAENYEELPAATAGYYYTFVCKDTDGMRITSVGDDTIRIGAYVTGTASYVNTTKIGNTINLLAVSSTEWVATSWTGVWRIAGAAYACSPGQSMVLYAAPSEVTVSSAADGQTMSIPASQLQDAGDTIEVEFSATLNASTNYTHRLKFGGTALFSIANNGAMGEIVGKALIVRTGSATESCSVSISGAAIAFNATQVTYTGATETLSGALTLKTEISAFTAGSITYRTYVVKFHKSGP